MTEQHIATIVERALGEQATHLQDGITRLTHQRVAGAWAPKAIVVNLDGMRSMARGTYRNFSVAGATEIYN